MQASTNPTKNCDELRCSVKVSSSCSTSFTCHVTLVTNPVMRKVPGKLLQILTELFDTPPTPKKYIISLVFLNGKHFFLMGR